MKNGLYIGLGAYRGGGFNPGSFLVGKKGAYFDPADATRLWQDSAGTVAATGATDPVGLYQGRGPLEPITWAQTADANRPTRSSNRLAFPSTQSMDGGPNLRAVLNAANHYYAEGSATVTALAGIQTLFIMSTNGAAATRFAVSISATGFMRVVYRRLDADSPIIVTATIGAVTAGVPFTFKATADILGGGVGALGGWINGTRVITADIAGTGAAEATDSARSRLGADNAGTPGNLLTGSLGRLIFANTAPTGSDAASLSAWVAAGA
jgi:hypothetical protein